MHVELLSSSAPEWRAYLERGEHDFYHLPAYAELSASLDGGTARALLVTEDSRSLLLPFVARPIPRASSNEWDAVSPYGYPGPLLLGVPDDERNPFASRALESARQRLREERCVSLFVRLHPLLGPRPTPEGAQLVQHGETVVIDLRKTEAEHWSETMSGHRNEINRAIKSGHRAYFDDAFVHADRFVEIYQATMSRVGASAYYFFDRKYLDHLRRALDTRLKLAVVEIDGAIAAAGLFVETGAIVQYHLSGTDEAHRKRQPTKLMLHFVRGWARERGDHWMHLGGGVGGAADSLFKFKAGFSTETRAFHTLRMIIDEAAYSRLVKEKHPSEGVTTNLGGFFPLYRRP